jgi:CBS domain-containing protein
LDREEVKKASGSIQADADFKIERSMSGASQNSRRNKVYETLMKYTGEADTVELPITTKVLDWSEFNSDFWSTRRSYDDIATTAEQFKNSLVDLRPYMIEAPYVIHTTDRLPKVLNYFRHFHLRSLPVIDPSDGKPVAILTRQDLFAYMSL